MCLKSSEETRTGVWGRMMAEGEVRGPHNMLMKVHRVTGTAQDRGVRGVCLPLKSIHSILYMGEDTSAKAVICHITSLGTDEIIPAQHLRDAT